MTGFIEHVMGRSRTVVMTLILILTAGTATYMAIPKEAEPDVEIPVIYVRMTHEGISPEDSERLLVRPMEQELRSIEGIKEMTASAYEGGGSVTLEFYAGVDTDGALQDVREKVDVAKAELPEETEEPRVNEVKMSKLSPMLVINISGTLPERALIKLGKDLKEEIEGIPGVLEVDLQGDREEVMEVMADPLAMESYHLSQADLFNFVSRNNRLVAAGSLDTGRGRFAVKVPGVFESPEDVLNLPVKVDGSNVVRFRDISQVRRTFKDPQSYARIDGSPAIGLEVSKRAGANILETVDSVLQVLEESARTWPSGVEYTISRNKGDIVLERLNTLQNSVISAVLLVFLVIIGSLGIRNALLVGIAIPGSFLLAILALGLFDVTMNMVVLFALIMAVGLLVDGAIVVTELADRKMADGMHRAKAYALASRRMAMPIIASTVTTLAAFVPLLFWPGIMGEFMKYMPITVIATLSASLLMALVLVPALGAMIGKSGALSGDAAHQLSAAETGHLHEITGFTGRYVRFLQKALRHPWIGVAGVTVLLIAIFLAYANFGRGVENFPETEPSFINLTVKARGDLSIDEQDEIVREIEARLDGLEDFTHVYARSGRGGREADDVVGSIKLNLKSWRVRRGADDIIAELRDRTADLAGIELEFFKPRFGPPKDKDISIELAAVDARQLLRTTDRLRRAMDDMPGLQDIIDSRPLPGIEWRLSVDREQAGRFGADITLVGNAVQLVTNGVKIGEYRPDDSDDELDIRVRYPVAKRNIEQIDTLRVTSSAGMVPISNFVVRKPEPKVSSIERTDMRRTLMVEANVQPGVLAANKVAEIRQLIERLDFDPGVSIRFTGEDQELRDNMAFLKKAFLAALFIISIILVTQFNSIYQAFLILTAVLFSTGGVLLGLMVADMAFGVVMSGLSVIALAGIVVNNNIVLIDTYNHMRANVSTGTDAIIRTCAQRLRPVLLTTVTTILGLMPMVLSMNIDLVNRDVFFGSPTSEMWRQLASGIAVGLAFATILTLVLTPSLLQIQQNVSRRVHGKRVTTDGGDLGPTGGVGAG